jgi:hypothetical protein
MPVADNDPGYTTRTMPQGSVVITPADMYAEIRATYDEVKRLGTVLEPSLRDLSGRVEDHETRIRGLERRLWTALGAGVVLAGPLGAVAGVLIGT